MSMPLFSRAVVPYSRLELPGWGRVLRAAGVYQDDKWSGAPTRVIRGKLHGYTMRLSLESWSERQTYFLGRYYDLPSQAYISGCLRPGDTFIDIGGNIGMMTLLGSHAVGPTGRVHMFEPNPAAGARAQRTLDENGITNVTLHPMGLSDAPAELTLSVVSKHSGLGTFAPVRSFEAKYVSVRHIARVVRGDDVLPPQLAGDVTIKIDVEGFECRALRGLSATLAKYRPAVVGEVIEKHLIRAGSSGQELLDLMAEHGYQGYRLSIRRKLGRQRLSLIPITRAEQVNSNNVAWLYPGTVQSDRLGPSIDA